MYCILFPTGVPLAGVVGAVIGTGAAGIFTGLVLGWFALKQRVKKEMEERERAERLRQRKSSKLAKPELEIEMTENAVYGILPQAPQPPPEAQQSSSTAYQAPTAATSP